MLHGPGDAVIVRSIDHPGRCFQMDFMDIVCVPADMGRYEIVNLVREPVRVHKTTLREGFENDPR